MPRSAAASAGPSFTPSPTIATRCPRACRSRTASALPAWQDPGDHLLDAHGRGDRPGGRLVVPGEQDRPQAEAAQSGDGDRGRRLDRVTDGDRAAQPTVPADQDRGRPARSHCAHWAASPGGIAIPRSRSSRSRPTTTWRPSTTPRAPRPGSARKASTSSRDPPAPASPSLAAPSQAAQIAAATGCSEAASSTAAAWRSSSAGSVPGAAASAVTVIRPLATVPVLSNTTVLISPGDSSA